MWFVHRLVWFVFLILIQVLILNHVHIGGYAMPICYIYYIFIISTGVPKKSLLLQSFLLGLCVDIFSNTPGINAAASTFLAFIRPKLLDVLLTRDVNEEISPSIISMNFSPFLRYLLFGTFLHVFIVQLIDTFSFVQIVPLFFRVITSTITSVVLMICIDSIRRNK